MVVNAGPMDEPLREELLRRAARDQEARRTADADPEPMLAIDAENLPWLKGVIEAKGWPTRSTVGEQASHAAWLLVQHADKDPAFQHRCLELLTTAATKGEADPQEVAYLTDRVCLAERRPQVYGTQVTARGGRWVPRSLQDPPNVDERRAAVGLEPMEDYLARFGDPPGPNFLPCLQCDSSIEFWSPELGEHVQLTCPSCGWKTVLSLDPQ